MGNLNSAPNANRVRIGFFGSRNAGKSSLVNAFAGQEVSIVSDTPGTTTDPVVKAMELLPVGAVTLVDTAGADDGGELGSMRVKRTDVELDRCDVALLVADATKGLTLGDKELLEKIRLKKIPFLVVFNKCDLTRETGDEPGAVRVSAKTGENINRLREAVAALAKTASSSVGLFDGILDKEDVVLFVTPIDASAPKGRMILPQVRALRDVLDKKAVCVFCQTEQLPAALSSLKNSPKLVVTDSQAFGAVKKMLPESQRLTSFSILLAYVNGILSEAVKGAAALSELKDGDTVLIAEGCTHHRQCEDIGTVKLPKWIEEFSGRKLNFRFTSGNSFPESLSGTALAVHCGGCMLNEKEMARRRETAVRDGVPFCNYGIAIAHINGILKRSLEIFPELAKMKSKATRHLPRRFAFCRAKILSVVLQIVYKVFAGFGGIDRATGSKIKA